MKLSAQGVGDSQLRDLARARLPGVRDGFGRAKRESSIPEGRGESELERQETRKWRRFWRFQIYLMKWEVRATLIASSLLLLTMAGLKAVGLNPGLAFGVIGVGLLGGAIWFALRYKRPIPPKGLRRGRFDLR